MNKDKKDSKIWIEKTIVKGRPDREEGARKLGVALWSPRTSKNGRDIYKNMREVNPGDIVLHLIDNDAISGVSIVSSEAQEADGLTGTGWEGPALLIHLQGYKKLKQPLNRNDILSPDNRDELLRISKSSEVFYNEVLNLRQGAYLTPCSMDLYELINNMYLKATSENLPYYYSNNGGKVIEPFERRHSFDSNLFSIIKTKPFVLLAGLSGTGKTRLVKELAYLFCSRELQNTQSPGNYQLIKVKPNWHDSSELIGYESRINEPRYIVTEFIRFLAKAWMFPNVPFFLCLDEMNLAPVEQYFAEYLSILETRVYKDNRLMSEPFIAASVFNKYGNDDFWKDLEIDNDNIKSQFEEIGLTFPNNLIVMGTVNMDETTFSFSRKVLDRAMTIEIDNIELSIGLDESADIWKYPTNPYNADLVIPKFTHGYQVADHLGEMKGKLISYLERVNRVLENTPFKIAYRVRDEFLMFTHNIIGYNKDVDLSSVLDEMTYMKVLPRIEGDEDKTDVFDELISLFDELNLTKSSAKASYMKQMREKNHYTSFWI